MDQTTAAHGEKQGWTARLLTVAAAKTLGRLAACDMGMSPGEAQLFLSSCGLEAGKAMMDRSPTRLKLDEKRNDDAVTT